MHQKRLPTNQTLKNTATGVQGIPVMEEPSIEQRIQALPQELRDIIFDFTVAIKPGQTVALADTGFGARLNVPWQLQINPALRKELAPIYFGSSSFLEKLPMRPRIRGKQPPVAKWLAAQTASHQAMIKDIRLEIEDHNDELRNMLEEKSREDSDRFYVAGYYHGRLTAFCESIEQLPQSAEVQIKVVWKHRGEWKEGWAADRKHIGTVMGIRL